MKTLLLFFICACSLFPAQSNDAELVKSTVQQLFSAMKEADSAKLKSTFTKDAIMQTITQKGEVKTSTVQDFAESISKAKKGLLDEKITFSSVLIDGNLASVWTPYEFFLNGQFLHCGVNSFQLVKENEVWKIQYIIDTRRKENCKK